MQGCSSNDYYPFKFARRRFKRDRQPLDPCLGAYENVGLTVSRDNAGSLLSSITRGFSGRNPLVHGRSQVASDPVQRTTNPSNKVLLRARSLEPPPYPRDLIRQDSSQGAEMTELPAEVTVEDFLRLQSKPRNTRTYGKRKAKNSSSLLSTPERETAAPRRKRSKAKSKHGRGSFRSRLLAAGAHIPQPLGPNGTPPLDFGPIRNSHAPHNQGNKDRWKEIDPKAPIRFPTPFFAKSNPEHQEKCLVPITARQPIVLQISTQGVKDTEALDSADAASTPSPPAKKPDIELSHGTSLLFIPLAEHEEQLKRQSGAAKPK